ncbi:MAG: GDSL-type esterase/lipase family protein, partial [Candidatus Methanoperedens sp.]|nr:GDSL-type esterase/lipase family protein [Candidatus Methanoperedens sp.]
MQLGITKLEKIGFALLSLFFFAATVTAYTVGSGQDINPDIYHNANEWITGGTSLLKLSKTAPYAEIPIQRGANWGGTDREFIQAGHNNRIRQNGTIYQIRFAAADASIITQFYFTIWRKIGNNYDRVAITDDLKNLISNGTNVIDLSTPIEGIQEGDFYGYHIKASGDALYVDKEYTNKTRYDNLTYYADGGATSITNYNWSGQTSANYVSVIEPYMENPYMVFIGDSITSGHGNGDKPDEHYSFIEYDKDKTNIQATIQNQWSKKVNYRTYQNMGFGGQKTSTINNRFNSDVVSLSPEFVLIEDHPVNDTITGISTSTILINWEYMIQKAYYNNITPVIMLISPWTNGSNTQLNQFTDINDQLIRIAAKYPPSIVVDARCYVGVERSTGPSGNCWDINPLYTFDGLHYNSAGNERIAQAIKDSFRFVHGKPGLYNLIQSDGTMIYSMNLRNAKNTSWRMASTSGIANVSYNTPSSGELARMTVNSGTVDWFNIGNISSNQVCDLLDSGDAVLQSASTVDGSV